jgi:hypothetical protein
MKKLNFITSINILMLTAILLSATAQAKNDKDERYGKRDRTLVGTPGPMGPTGPQGPQGVVGPAGANGITGTAPGDMQYWNGSAWVLIPVSENNTVLKNCNGIPTWVVAHCGNFEIGDIGPGGGMVFLITDELGLHGLEAALHDSQVSSWGCYGTDIVGTSESVGDGLANTDKIIAGCSDDNTAAKLARNDYSNVLREWYLPSLGELSAMYMAIGQGANPPHWNLGGFANKVYWSSTQDDNNNAWFVNFSDSSQAIPDKNSVLNIRPIRSF